MEEYPKIQTLFKRDMDGPKKGRMIRDAWTTPELEYLAGNEWEFTEKIDGTNIRIGWDWPAYDVEFGGRTDNAVIPTPLLNYLEDKFTPYLFQKSGFTAQTKMVLFGEGYGPKIQNGGKYRADASFILFDVKINGFWLSRDNVNDIAKKLGIDAVPVLGTGTLHDAIDIVSTGITFNKSGAVVRWGSKGLTSRLASCEAEGIVARPKANLFDNQGKRIITKIKAVDFK